MTKFALTVLSVALLGATAAADTVSAQVRRETDTLARQYAGKVCRADYDLDTDRFGKRLSAEQIRGVRIKIYNDWKRELEEDAREDGDTYKIGYTNNRVWAWQRDARSNQTEFKVVTISATEQRELGCEL